eukprot:gnl/TRDRNA2_/TRDRNA2_110724_c0_seq1.p1 gnl/TRDRNA2_/TRDRNA2_110724_c0~~gnl/TRDRNA2_/TRDRNA2_110724_c0_seq1.p1  ORF type:complete len:161 (+),score=21.40 gnl/TRDRNA2_/TRDRNA2_110724_c0_seq1:3-485(+)
MKLSSEMSAFRTELAADTKLILDHLGAHRDLDVTKGAEEAGMMAEPRGQPWGTDSIAGELQRLEERINEQLGAMLIDNTERLTCLAQSLGVSMPSLAPSEGAAGRGACSIPSRIDASPVGGAGDATQGMSCCQQRCSRGDAGRRAPGLWHSRFALVDGSE